MYKGCDAGQGMEQDKINAAYMTLTQHWQEAPGMQPDDPVYDRGYLPEP